MDRLRDLWNRMRSRGQPEPIACEVSPADLAERRIRAQEERWSRLQADLRLVQPVIDRRDVIVMDRERQT